MTLLERLKAAAHRVMHGEKGKPAQGLKPILPMKEEKLVLSPQGEAATTTATAAEPLWLLAVAPGVFGEGVETVRAADKSQARSRFKQRLGLERLPPGTVVERVA